MNIETKKESVNAKEVRFIKLGLGGDNEAECIDSVSPTIKLGFHNPHHQKCLDGDWDFINEYWQQTKTKGKATETTNQIRDFYTQPPTTMWITFYKRKLYWCFADEKITQLPDGSRVRDVIGNWSCSDIDGTPLYVETLRGNLTKVQMFRGTICSVRESKYLLRRINNQTLPEVSKAIESLTTLTEDIKPLIKSLSWQDFELLVDLLFSNAGWQRICTLGKVEKSIDLDAYSPVSGRRAFIQVKSQSNIETFKRYIEEFQSMTQYDEMYYVVHSNTLPLEELTLPQNIQLIGLDHLAKLVLNAGLPNWLITKSK